MGGSWGRRYSQPSPAARRSPPLCCLLMCSRRMRSLGSSHLLTFSDQQLEAEYTKRVDAAQVRLYTAGLHRSRPAHQSRSYPCLPGCAASSACCTTSTVAPGPIYAPHMPPVCCCCCAAGANRLRMLGAGRRDGGLAAVPSFPARSAGHHRECASSRQALTASRRWHSGSRVEHRRWPGCNTTLPALMLPAHPPCP